MAGAFLVAGLPAPLAGRAAARARRRRARLVGRGGRRRTRRHRRGQLRAALPARASATTISSAKRRRSRSRRATRRRGRRRPATPGPAEQPAPRRALRRTPMAFMLAYLKVPLIVARDPPPHVRRGVLQGQLPRHGGAARLLLLLRALPGAAVPARASPATSRSSTLIDDMFAMLGRLRAAGGADDHHRPDPQDLRRRAGRPADPRHADRALEQLGGDDGDHRHAEHAPTTSRKGGRGGRCGSPPSA